MMNNPLSKPQASWYLDIVQRQSRCPQIVPPLALDWPALLIIFSVNYVIIVMGDLYFDVRRLFCLEI